MSKALQYFKQAIGEQLTPGQVVTVLEDLRSCQREERQRLRVAGIEPVLCPVPLAWVALAEAVGLVVDLSTGKIVGGPELGIAGI